MLRHPNIQDLQEHHLLTNSAPWVCFSLLLKLDQCDHCALLTGVRHPPGLRILTIRGWFGAHLYISWPSCAGDFQNMWPRRLLLSVHSRFPLENWPNNCPHMDNLTHCWAGSSRTVSIASAGNLLDMELLWKRGKSPASARSRTDMVFTYTTIGASLDSTGGERVRPEIITWQ